MSVVSIPPRLAPVMSEQLTFLESSNRSSSEIEAAFRTMLAVVEHNISYAEQVGASAHACLASLENLRAIVLSLRSRYYTGAERERIYKVPARMAMWQVAQAVYGDASMVGLLYAVNAVADVNSIPAGSSIIVLPID